MSEMPSSLRSIPAVSTLLMEPAIQQLITEWGHDAVVQAVRRATDQARDSVKIGGDLPKDWPAAVKISLQEIFEPSLRPVINASGVIIQTNLGRAPLAVDAIRAIEKVVGGYCNLEYDLDAGERGSRSVHAEREICAITGAEAATVVNNNAAAVLLVLTALAKDREVVISRSQLVEIGGGFRIPEVMVQGGAKLVEVGTTNRTYVEDYLRARTAETALFMFVHRSNFYLGGFIHEPSLAELADAAHAGNIYFYADIGSGALLDTAVYGMQHEVTPQECLVAGADIVSFSGDKLLGGPQAGIIAGKKELVGKIKQHPLMRALRVGKLTYAALQASLQPYRLGLAAESLPLWRMIAAPVAEMKARAEHWAQVIGYGEVRAAESMVGGGSLPGQMLPTFVLALQMASPQVLAAYLRAGDPPVVARIMDDAVLLDPRTILSEQEPALLLALRKALHRVLPNQEQ